MAATSTLSGTASSSTWGSQLNDYLDAHESISTQMDAHLRQLPPPPILAEEKQMRLGEEKLYNNGPSAVDNKYARLDEEGREFLRRLREYRSGYGDSSVLLGGAGKGIATGDAYHCPEVECAGAGRGPQASGAGDAAKMEKSKPCRAPPSSTQLLLPAHRSADRTPQFTTRTPSSSSSRPRLREEERDLSSAGMTASPSRSPSSFREELAHVLQEYRSGLESTAVRMPLRGLPPEDGLLQKDSTIESRSSRLQVLLDQKVLNRPKGSIFPVNHDKRKSDRRSRSRSRSRSYSANGARSTRASSVVAGAGGGRRGVEVGAVSMLELDAKLSTNRSTARAAAAPNGLHSTSVSIIRPRTGSSGSTSTPSFSRTKTPPTAGRGGPPSTTSLRSSGAAASSRSHFRSINLRQGGGAGERGSGFAAPQPQGQEEDINQHEDHHLHSGSTFLRESRDVFYDDPYCNPNSAADHWMNPPPTTAAQHLMPPPGASMQMHNSDIFGESALFYDDVLCNIRAPPVPHDEDQGERFATAEVEVDNDEKSSSDLGDVSMSSSHDSDCSVASSTSSSSSRASGETGTSEDGSDASPVVASRSERSSSSRRRTEDASCSRRSRGLMRNGKSSRAKPSRSKEKATTGVKAGCFPSSPHRKRKVKAAKSDQQKSIKSSNSRSSSMKGSASHSVTFPSKGESKVIRFSGASPTPQHGAGEESTTAEVDSAPGSRSASVSIHAGATVAGGSHQQQERGRAFISHNKMRNLSHDATSYLQKRSSKNKSPHPRRRFLEPQTLSGGARLPAAPPPTTTEEQIPTKCAQETRGPSTTIAGAKFLGTICATGTDQQNHQFNELQEGGVPALHPPSLNTSVCCEQSFLASTSAVSTPMRTAVNASTRRVSVNGVLSSSTITQALAEEAVQPVSAYRKRSTSSPNVGLAGIAAGSSQLPEPSGCSMRVGDLAKTPVRKSSAAQQTQRQPAPMPAFSIAPRIEAEGPRSREQTRLSNEGADEKAQLSELELLKKIALASEDDTHAGSSPQLQHSSSAWKPWSASQHRSPQPLSLCGPPAWDLSTDPVTGAITVRGPPGEAGEMKLTGDDRGLYDSDTSGEPCANVFQKLHKKDTPKALGVASRGVSSDLGRGGGASPTPPADSCPAEQDNSTLNYSTTSSILNNSVLNVPQNGSSSSSLNVLPNNSLHLIDTSFDEVSFSRIFSQAMASAQEKHGVDFRKPSLLMGMGSTSVGAAADGPCGGGGPPPESSTSLPAIPECATPPASEDNAAAFTMPPAPAAATTDFFTLPPGGKQPRASAPRSPPGGGRATKGILKQPTGASTERNTDATEATPDRRPVPVVAARARPKKETGKINFLENAEKYVADLFDSDVFKQRRAAAMGHKRTPGVEDVDLDEQAPIEKENECSCSSGPTETQRTGATEGLLLGGTGNGRSPSCSSPPLLPCKLEDVITSGPGLSDYDRILEDIRFQARQSGTAPECGPQDEREATSSSPGARAEPSTDSRREEAEQRWSVEAAIANGGSMMEIDKSAARVACDVLHERNQSLLRDILGELEEPDRQDELMAQCVHGVQARKAGPGGASAAPAEAATSRRTPPFVGAQERAAEQRTQRLPASQLTIYAFGDAKTTSTVSDLSVCDADGEDPRDEEKKASSLDEMVDEAIERKSSTCRSTLAEIEAYCDQMKKKTANIVEEDSFRSQLLKCIGMARDLKLHGLH